VLGDILQDLSTLNLPLPVLARELCLRSEGQLSWGVAQHPGNRVALFAAIDVAVRGAEPDPDMDYDVADWHRRQLINRWTFV
jgi:hypothetical protein